MTLLLVALLGGLGAATRFLVDGAIRARWTSAFPAATIVINVSGSFVIGLLTGAALDGGVAPATLVVAATGFCGGYTTFSTAMVDAVRLVQAGEHRRAVAYLLGTTVLAVAAVALGVLVARAAV